MFYEECEITKYWNIRQNTQILDVLFLRQEVRKNLDTLPNIPKLFIICLCMLSMCKYILTIKRNALLFQSLYYPLLFLLYMQICLLLKISMLLHLILSFYQSFFIFLKFFRLVLFMQVQVHRILQYIFQHHTALIFF